ncbi:MAG: carboxyl-terminal processing protease [Cognaticolwellia sp.]|jgi:carboxyl-terminal processing protease
MRLLLPLVLLLSCIPMNRRGSSTGGGAKLQMETFEYVWERVGAVYPDPDMDGVDWQGVHDELYPQAKRARSAEALRPVLNDMISRLEVSHFAVFPGGKGEDLEFSSAPTGAPVVGAGIDGAVAQASDADVGLEVRYIGGEMVVTRVRGGSSADQSGIKAGWVVLSIGETDVALQAAQVDPDSAQDQGDMARAASGAFLGSASSSLSLSARSPEGEAQDFSLERQASAGEMVQVGFMPPMRTEFELARVRGGVGVLRFNVFMPPVAPAAEAALTELALEGAPGVIFDLRGNPGGVIAIASGLAGYLVDERSSLGTMISRDADLNLTVFPRPPDQRIHGPVAILVDELSYSSSEILAHGLQATGRARVFGTPTVGACLPSTVDILPNGDRLQYVLADLVGPSGQRIEGVGVTPDVIVPRNAEALAAGRDDALDAAVCWILEDCE